MLKKMIINLSYESERRLDHNISSLMHGALIELIVPNYAEILHKSNLKPYSQYLETFNQMIRWHINTLDEEAARLIIGPLLSESFESIRLEHKDLKLTVIDKELKEQTFDNLFHEYYFRDGSRYIEIRFVTPTAFKRQGEYIFYPEVRLLYQSLINKFDAYSKEVEIDSEETLEQLVEHTVMTRYDLKSDYFHLEGVRIPAFIGRMTMKVNGPQALVNLANLLIAFGEYSGVGIKNAIGMGAMRRISAKGGLR